ncbi:MAG: AraC family transcriptional regulator [Bradyrhizobium sp.]|nr:AraC family transcriptional regulator [Bradyrhizobium sp.]
MASSQPAWRVTGIALPALACNTVLQLRSTIMCDARDKRLPARPSGAKLGRMTQGDSTSRKAAPDMVTFRHWQGYLSSPLLPFESLDGFRDPGLDNETGSEALAVDEPALATRRRPHKKISLQTLLNAHRSALGRAPNGALERGIARKRLELMPKPLWLALRTAATLGAALEIFDRFWILAGSIYAVNVDPRADRTRITLSHRVPHPGDLAVSIQAVEMMAIWWLIQDLVGSRFTPLFCASPAGEATLIATFAKDVGGEIMCGQDCWLDMPAGALDQPLGRADRSIHAEAAADCQREVRARERRATLLDRIDQELAHLEEGAPSIGYVSRQLGMSERTLRRRLTESGTSYNKLLEERRLSIAKTWLVNGTATTAMIAGKLGYSEPSNFRHAFKRWTGSSPTGYSALERSNDRTLGTAA